jgi:hypothetical protein
MHLSGTPKRSLRVALLTAAAALTVAGCNPNGAPSSVSSAPAPLAALPLAESGAPPIAPAPSADALPPAPPVRVGQLADSRQLYAYADNAYAMNQGFGDAPPDYAFDYQGGERPWVWQGDDRSTRIAEPLSDGGDRYYYYEPGQDRPYLVRDRDYSYGYDNGVLVVVYDRGGRALRRDEMDRLADLAGRFLWRGHDVFDASRHRRREAVAAEHWRDRRDAVDSERAQWDAAQAANADWRD